MITQFQAIVLIIMSFLIAFIIEHMLLDIKIRKLKDKKFKDD